MRISDWSSDVCSSDLAQHCRRNVRRREPAAARLWADGAPGNDCGRDDHRCAQLDEERPGRAGPRDAPDQRSEEHTSELQSLMRISYAVFCLKNKNSNSHTYNNQTTNSKTRKLYRHK